MEGGLAGDLSGEFSVVPFSFAFFGIRAPCFFSFESEEEEEEEEEEVFEPETEDEEDDDDDEEHEDEVEDADSYLNSLFTSTS